jgi:hypothetical protein
MMADEPEGIGHYIPVWASHLWVASI